MIPLLCLMATLLLGLRWPGVLIAGIFYGYPVTVLSGISVTTIYTVAAAGIAILLHVAARKRVLLTHLDIAFTIFILWCCISLLWAPDQTAAVAAARTLALSAFGLYVMARLVFSLGDDRTRLREMAVTLCVLGLIVTPFLALRGELINGRIALDGNSNIAVGLTQSFVTTFIAALALFVWPRGERLSVRLFAILSIAMCLVAIRLTGTRGALMGILIGLMFFTILNGRFSFVRRLRWPTLSILILALGAAVVMVDWGALANSRLFNFESYGSVTDNSSLGRYMRYRAAWGMIGEAPLLGNGISAFATETGLGYPHNIFLEIWADFGGVGLLLFLTLLGIALMGARRLQWQGEDVFATMLFAIILTGLAHHQISFYLAAAKQIFLIAGIAGALVSGRALRSGPVPVEPSLPGRAQYGAV
ncbi:O-antigen ligase [Puniceibacterium sp. IMCC21224]|uniref:O-antigen ligase family protein n=1 Tax=Puniceibacterium sp. IMCC21224 TaxID=1618204 RepID=UPI00064DFE30|nr:O-antigen ligase family protein [Puniceibacterium sp. IMCC21224]KMK63833.1 lipid A core-O-antigen ligase-like enyme [Puniceibacterium sp. IMCC21224]